MDQQSGANWTEERVIGILRDLAMEKELPEHLVDGTIVGADTLDSLGIDSIGAVAIIFRLEAQAGEQLPDDFIEIDESVGNITMRMNSLK